MASLDPTLFSRTHQLADGMRVRLRLARAGDQRPLAALMERLGYPASAAELADLVRFDPGDRLVICATALVDGRERMLGFCVGDPETGSASAAAVVDPQYADELSRLLRRAIHSRRGRRRDRSAGVVLSGHR